MPLVMELKRAADATSGAILGGSQWLVFAESFRRYLVGSQGEGYLRWEQ